MTWLLYLSIVTLFAAWALSLLAFWNERKAHSATRAKRGQLQSDLDFTTEILSDKCADLAHTQDQVLALTARLRAQDIQRETWRGGLN